jgi:hypothetical protein
VEAQIQFVALDDIVDPVVIETTEHPLAEGFAEAAQPCGRG